MEENTPLPPKQDNSRKAQWLVLAFGLVLLIVLAFADRKVLVNEVEAMNATTGSDVPTQPKAPPGSEASTGQPLTLGELAPLQPGTEAANVIPQLQQKLAAARTLNDSLPALQTLVAASANLQRKDYAALYQEQIWLRTQGKEHLISAADLMTEARDLYQVLESRQAIARKFNDRAIALYARYLKDDPKSARAQLGLAVCRVNGDSPMDGILELRELVEKHADKPEIAFRGNKELGIFSLQTGQLEKAVDRFKSCIELEPNNFEGHYLLGAAYKMQNKPEQARPLFKKALSLSPDPKIQRQIANEIEQLSNTAHAH